MEKYVIVKTQCGQLRGEIQQSFENYDYCAFKGIPYAEPPINELRFSDPLPVKPWLGIRDVTNYGPSCGQSNIKTQPIEGDDDCLYLNVYVKSINSDNRLPVMVWIHGGGFMQGSGDDLLYGPDYFLKKDIVLVTINYRLGVLGFLNFDDEVAPGNQGLKDQIQALRWIKENIKCFGGDPDNVTIFGESAGGASAHYLTLTDLTKGLFHKAIFQSGVACNTWAFKPKNSMAYEICKILGNNSTNPKELVEFLRTIDCNKLIEAQEKLKTPDDKLHCRFPFGPGIDDKSKNPVVPMQPLKLIKKGVHVPLLIGNNSREGIFCLAGVKQGDFHRLENNFENYINPIIMDVLQRNHLSSNDLKRLYFGNEKFSMENLEKYADYWSDMHFICGIHKVLNTQVKKSSAPTYYYRFTYDKEYSITKTLANVTMSGTSHFDEVQYQFGMKLYDMLNIERPKPGTTSYKIIEQIIEMWVNFAKCGRPTPETSDLIPTYWLPVADENIFRALNINENLQMENVLYYENYLSFGKHLRNKL